jgi:cytochrome P450
VCLESCSSRASKKREMIGLLEITAPDLASPAFKANPHPFFARLREESPVWRTTLPDRRTAWLVTRYEDVAGVLKDNNFAKDPLNARTRSRGPKVHGSLAFSSLSSKTCSTSTIPATGVVVLLYPRH